MRELKMRDFSFLDAYIDQVHQDKQAPACGVIVSRGHEVLHWYGAGMAQKQKPITENTLFWLYSCTKPITVVAAMQLVESGKMGLDDLVSRYLPEYADAFLLKNKERYQTKKPMCIRHLFTMSAGLTYDIHTLPIQMLLKKEGPAASTRRVVSAFVQSPLSFEPGTQYQYSLCLDVLAAVVEVVSGQSFGEYLKKHIFIPLGMENTGFWPTADQQLQFADQYTVDTKVHEMKITPCNIGGLRISNSYESGGAGLFSCGGDFARFARAMACGGVGDTGERILRSETIDLMRTPQIGSYVMNNTFSCAAGVGYSYGLGVRVLVDRSAGQRSSLGEFGWDGAAGSYILVDPTTQISIVYMQHTLNWPEWFGLLHAPVRDLSYVALGL